MGIIDWIVKISEMRERGKIDRERKRKRGRGAVVNLGCFLYWKPSYVYRYTYIQNRPYI